MSDVGEVERLRALAELMREGRLTRIVLSDGTTLERSPFADDPAPATAAIVAAARAADTVPPAQVADGQVEADDDAGEEEAEASLRKRWDGYWTRMTASSGAPIPDFPGVATASRMLRGA